MIIFKLNYQKKIFVLNLGLFNYFLDYNIKKLFKKNPHFISKVF